MTKKKFDNSQQRQRPAAPLPFDSLEAALEEWFDKPFAELPAELQQRIARVPMPWDHEHWTPEWRRRAAQQWDYQHDPNTAGKRQQAWDQVVLTDVLRREIAEVSALPVASFDERERQKKHIAALQSKLTAAEGTPGPARTQKKRWSDVELLALLDESRQLEMTQAKLATKHGVARQRISQLLAHAKSKFGPHTPSLAATGVRPRPTTRKRR